ncbi:MAG: chemotaxis protein CheV [Lachnospiraceae bacterium]|nr:chemotaxis protein CheV [Lachnospiraceae bacterium]
MDTNILLENGTNELEVLEFTLGKNHYGINVAKVREILAFQEVTPVPNSHPSVEGIFMPRDVMISVINLKNCIGMPDDNNEGFFIITNFNQLNIAFHVDMVLGIHRISWTDIILPGVTVSGAEEGVSTGVVKMDDRLIVILDFEKIVTDISPETGLKVSDIEKLGERERFTEPIYIAEDSALLSNMISSCLEKAGYTNLTICPNGQELWDKLEAMKKQGNVRNRVSLVITDIEMPMMDGHRLTKLIKSDDVLKEIPVVIFSSLVNDEMRRKGEALGADAQLSKPEIGILVQSIDNLLGIQGE